AGVGDLVVLASPPLGGAAPLGAQQAQVLESVQERVEHAVAPLQLAVRELADSREDRVAVARRFLDDRQHERCRDGRDEVLVDAHAVPLRWVTALYMALQGICRGLRASRQRHPASLMR